MLAAGLLVARRGALLFVAGIAASCACHAVDANDASVAELESIPGIGTVASALIVSEREKRRFDDWRDFRYRIKGTGPAVARRLSAGGLTVNGWRYDEPAAGASAPAPSGASAPSGPSVPPTGGAPPASHPKNPSTSARRAIVSRAPSAISSRV